MLQSDRQKTCSANFTPFGVLFGNKTSLIFTFYTIQCQLHKHAYPQKNICHLTINSKIQSLR
jgi:hypothetical protein